jgi:hypothetical protein
VPVIGSTDLAICPISISPAGREVGKRCSDGVRAIAQLLHTTWPVSHGIPDYAVQSIIGATEKRRDGSDGRRWAGSSVVGSMGQVNRSDEKDAQSNSSHVRLKPSLTKARALCRNGLIREVIKPRLRSPCSTA